MYGQQIDVDRKVTGARYEEMMYGMDMGADHAWIIDSEYTIYTGVFMGYGHSDRDMKDYSWNDSTSEAYYVGAYGTWINKNGVYVDAVVKVQRFDNDFSARDESGNTTSGGYDNWAYGASLEVGKQFNFEGGWFVQPNVQASFAHFTAAKYNTTGDNIFDVRLSMANVGQFRGGAIAGKTISLSGDNVLQPYVKANLVEQVSSGGKVMTGDGEWRPNFDGTRGEFGCGIIWQLDGHNQIHLDYETVLTSKYDKPWGINLGYRHQF